METFPTGTLFLSVNKKKYKRVSPSGMSPIIRSDVSLIMGIEVLPIFSKIGNED